jgi:hypothetical protein
MEYAAAVCPARTRPYQPDCSTFPTSQRNAQALYQRSEGATVDRWLMALPVELIRSRSRLSLARAILALLGGRADEVEPLLSDAERALATVDEAARGWRTSLGRSRCCVAGSPFSAAKSNARSS